MTHLCVMMGNYLVSACGRKTAVLEWKGQENFAKIEQACTGRKNKVQPFHLLGAAYYGKADETVLTACINLDYQHIIIDFGCIKEENRTEFSRCDRKLLVVSFSEWQMEAFWGFVQEGEAAGKKGWLYLAAFGSEETRREIIRRLKIPIERIPLSVDAFTVTRELMDWFERILTSHV